jgi:hypothetical protein
MTCVKTCCSIRQAESYMTPLPPPSAGAASPDGAVLAGGCPPAGAVTIVDPDGSPVAPPCPDWPHPAKATATTSPNNIIPIVLFLTT